MQTALKNAPQAECAWGFDEEAGQKLVAAARELAPLLWEKAAETNRLGTPVPEVVEALHRANIWSIAVPKRLGGHGASATALALVGRELAKGDPSVAWVSQIVNGTTWVTSLGPDALQDHIFANGVPRIIGAFNPPGTAIPVEGGYRVTGRWPYASGFRQAEWGQWGVNIVHDDGTVVRGNTVYIPLSQVRLDNTWDVTGLEGTGSDTGVVDDVFVPECCMVHADRSFNYVEPGKRNYGAPSDFFQQLPMVHRTMCGVFLGMGEKLLELTIETVKTKPLVGTTFARAADSPVVAKEVGEVAIKIDTARLLILDMCGTIDRIALERRSMTEPERAQNKAQGNYALQLIGEAVNTMMNINGSGSFNNSNPTSRLFRDFNMGARHFANISMVGFEVYGRSLLGLPQTMIVPYMY